MGVSFGIFLFLLFFQPFTIQKFDFNNTLLFIAGISAIYFMFLAVAGTLFPRFTQYDDTVTYQSALPGYIGGFGFLVLTTLALAFYLRYVGGIELSFFKIFKLVLISGSTLVILRVYRIIKLLKFKNEALLKEQEKFLRKIEESEVENQDKNITINSDYGTEGLRIKLSDIVLIKSADNYIEVLYNENGNYRKKLLRNTLKNIENQLRPYASFIRCHRTSIVNKDYVEMLSRKFNNHWLIIKNHDEEIPVSRQYLLKLKEVIA